MEGTNKIGARRRERERDVEKMNDEEGNGVG
jgi:hypothetical protein